MFHVKHWTERVERLNTLNEFISNYQSYIFIAMAIVVVLLLILVISAFKAIGKLENKYRKFTRGTDNKNIEQLVNSYLDKIDENKSKIEEVNSDFKALSERLNRCIQKTSIMRYKAFEDIGSDLSFSIALLDDQNTGFVITGIYGRNDTVVYAKPIDRGISRYELSQEEEKVLNNAMGDR
ncbi:DUF4446 family protein [Haloimpatiens sp. FM7330]|uniref:DUF4446 family protein n=1 Tax=Haloimpatiens sp. FM7330 TaxID=3298610 RepID=UPI0036255DE0